jgi:hypothetical protein
MRNIMKAVAASGLLLAGLTAANAQYRPRGDPGYYQDRDEDRDREGARFLDRVRADLDRAEATTVPFTGDRARIDRAREEVNAVQRKLEAGIFDRRELDDAIISVQHVLNDNRVMSDSTRDFLAADLNHMRDFRSQIESWR